MSEQEIWKDVVGYENVYHVSNLGRVKRIARGQGTWPGRILKACPNQGYLYIDLCHNGQRKSRRVHRLIAFAFLGNPPPGKCEVNHKNGIKADNRIVNLEWVTPSENEKHAFHILKVHNRKGVHNGNAKLNPSKVKKIRSLYQTGEYTQRSLAALFGVGKATITHILCGDTWRHI